MTPDVPRLREIRSGSLVPCPDSRAKWGKWIDWLARRQDAILDALLAAAPPDGAAEREAYLCPVCGTTNPACHAFHPHPTPAPTEAPAAGETADRFKNVSCVIQSGGGYSPRLIWSFDSLDDAHAAHALFRAALARPADQPMSDDQHIETYHEAYERGRREALAARPAAVTDARVVDAALRMFCARWPRADKPAIDIIRSVVEQTVEEAFETHARLVARGPA